MKVAVFSARRFEQAQFVEANAGRHDLVFLDARLSGSTCVLANGCRAVCLFVGDTADLEVLQRFREIGAEFLALRSTGFNHVDLKTS